MEYGGDNNLQKENELKQKIFNYHQKETIEISTAHNEKEGLKNCDTHRTALMKEDQRKTTQNFE